MSTVIFKWNPAFSSYLMASYLYDLNSCLTGRPLDYNWSVWDHDKIHSDDKFYWVKLGYGQTGIVGSGVVTSDPYEGSDWSGKGRRTFYVDFLPEVLLNPDALPILDTKRLTREIPDFEWDRGHSGLVLTPEQAEKLDTLWEAFLNENREKLEHLYLNEGKNYDRFYITHPNILNL